MPQPGGTGKRERARGALSGDRGQRVFFRFAFLAGLAFFVLAFLAAIVWPALCGAAGVAAAAKAARKVFTRARSASDIAAGADRIASFCTP